MSGLHQAVARAIASARGVEGVCDCSEEAAAAIAVCLAEAQRAVEARVPPIPAHYCDCEHCGEDVRAEALAVLAALAEEQA